MVKRFIKGTSLCYRCEACDMLYATEKLAQQCEDFCTKNKGCSLEITKHAIQLKGGKP